MTDSELPIRRAWILEEDRHLARAIADRLHARGMETACSESRGSLPPSGTDLAIIQLDLLGPCDVAMDRVRKITADMPVLLTTARAYMPATRSLTIDAEWVLRPICYAAFDAAIDRLLSKRELLADSHAARSPAFISSPSLSTLFERLAAAQSTLLLTGETGTGKTRLARWIHEHSSRHAKPFVHLSCGSLPSALIESELFGHVAGAFTDAASDKPGRFHLANGGTILLDEIDAAPLALQLRLLRVLQDKSFEPVGSNETQTVDVRIIAATNVDLTAHVAQGVFRDDLFHRLNVLSLDLPPLRRRLDELVPLFDTLLAAACAESGRHITSISASALRAMRAYHWPGNVRELENTIRRAVLVARSLEIDVDDLPPRIAQASTPNRPTTPLSLESALLGPEKSLIRAALERNNWCRLTTARELGIDRTTLYKKMRKHGLSAA